MKKKIIIVSLIAAIVSAYFWLDLGQYLDFKTLKDNQEYLNEYYQANKLLVIGIYFAIYVIVAGFSLPGAAIVTLAGGLILGRITGTIIVSFASTIGATIAFLIARALLGEYLQKKYKDKLDAINKGVEKDGAFYLLSLRLLPIFPFFVINLMMGLTKMNVWRYFIVSQIGMLPGTFVYVNAGTAFSEIEQLSDVASFEVLASFALLGLLPLIIKGFMVLLNKIKKKK